MAEVRKSVSLSDEILIPVPFLPSTPFSSEASIVIDHTFRPTPNLAPFIWIPPIIPLACIGPIGGWSLASRIFDAILKVSRLCNNQSEVKKYSTWRSRNWRWLNWELNYLAEVWTQKAQNHFWLLDFGKRLKMKVISLTALWKSMSSVKLLRMIKFTSSPFV